MFPCDECNDDGGRCSATYKNLRSLRSHVLRVHHRIYSSTGPSILLEGPALEERLEKERRRQKSSTKRGPRRPPTDPVIPPVDDVLPEDLDDWPPFEDLASTEDGPVLISDAAALFACSSVRVSTAGSGQPEAGPSTSGAIPSVVYHPGSATSTSSTQTEEVGAGVRGYQAPWGHPFCAPSDIALAMWLDHSTSADTIVRRMSHNLGMAGGDHEVAEAVARGIAAYEGLLMQRMHEITTAANSSADPGMMVVLQAQVLRALLGSRPAEGGP